jgi:hypothetical protein
MSLVGAINCSNVIYSCLPIKSWAEYKVLRLMCSNTIKVEVMRIVVCMTASFSLGFGVRHVLYPSLYSKEEVGACWQHLGNEVE